MTITDAFRLSPDQNIEVPVPFIVCKSVLCKPESGRQMVSLDLCNEEEVGGLEDPDTTNFAVVYLKPRYFNSHRNCNNLARGSFVLWADRKWRARSIVQCFGGVHKNCPCDHRLSVFIKMCRGQKPVLLG